jgi:hypothetical protein
MPKVTGPLFSLSARKTFGKTLTFQTRPSGTAVFIRKSPHDTKTANQIKHRDIIAQAVAKWQYLGTIPQTKIISQIANNLDDAMENGTGQLETSGSYNMVQSDTNPASVNYYCAGLRFKVNIPQGAIIDSAFLSLYMVTSGDADLKIYAHNVNNSENFSDNPHIISEVNRPRTTAFTEWQETNIIYGWKTSPNIKEVIQEIISKANWVANNYLTLLLIANKTATKSILFQDWIYWSEYGAKLTIYYHIPGPTGQEAWNEYVKN